MKHFHKIGLGLLFLFISASVFYFYSDAVENEIPLKKKFKSSASPHAGKEMKKARLDYFFNMLKDPATNEIPHLIRQRELEFAEKLNRQNFSLRKSAAATWAEAGPKDVGGRTRALAVDVTNPNNIVAGGASGGIWKSTDKGSTWILKSTSAQILSVTSVAQDPRQGKTNVWYYTSGEYDQNLAGSYASAFFGNGIYKSTDNGETWNVLASTYSPDITRWDKDFDFALRVVVSPVNGNVFVAVNGSGIFRSTDEGNSFTRIIGDVNHHIFSDVSVASNGNLLAVVSTAYQGITATKAPGVYKSTDNGQSWTNIPVSGLPAISLRGIITFAPSNPNTAYLLSFGYAGNNEVIKFYKINFNSGTSEDRSANIPDFRNEYPQTGSFNPQGGYNMTVAVKPDDENFVLLGATNIFRSTNGFATKPTNAKATWIGGYFPASGYATYPNSHPDIHSYAFDPTDPKKMWWGHDGGLSYTTDITNNSFAQYFPWESKNNGYNVTQFYHISISQNSGDNRIMGGCQDNGTPYFLFNNSTANQIDDVSSGDGSFSYFGQNFAYTSAQNGAIIRLKYDQQKNPVWNGWSEVSPTGVSNQLFINPFAVDPNNENVLYYPAGNVLWRNNQLGSIPDGSNGTTMGWTKLDNLTLPEGYGFTSLAVSNTPSGILYYAANKSQSPPKIFKLANASTATSGAVEIPIAGAPAGAYINNIAVNPDDANEILVVMANYNIVGLYHSTNGGQSFTAVEGNLTGTQQNPGPSLRAATILPGSGYYLATSVGVFSTSQLNGNNTNWIQEGQDVMGNVIVSHITSRKSDGRVVAGTHGRGAFVGSAGGSGAAVLNVSSTQINLGARPGETGQSSFSISNSGGANLSFNLNVTGGPVLNITYPEVPKSTLLFSGSETRKLNNMVLKKISSKKYEGNPVFSIPISTLQTEELILDDGNSSPAGFLGMGGGVHFYSANDFKLDKDFSLEKVKFFMTTESQNTNPVGIAVTKGDDILFDQTINMGTSPASGKWFEYDFPQSVLNSLKFKNGESFQLIIITQNTALAFPAGYDDNALKPGNSYWAYYDPLFSYFSAWQNLNGISQNGAWLIRAVGNSDGGGTNQLPVANAQVSPNPANVNQPVSFNGSGSSDADGQITQYLWNFGDGTTSSQMNASHSYTQAGQFNYKLTVTDDKGGTGEASGQITISDQPSRWVISPASGSVAAGGSQNITISFNAAGLAEGNYQAQLNILSNGGNMVIPISLTISSTVDVDDEAYIPGYILQQNYPNPFNPSTTISFSILDPGFVTLKIFDALGKEVKTLLSEDKTAGNYKVEFNAAGLSSGIYYYTLNAGKYAQTKKLILLK